MEFKNTYDMLPDEHVINMRKQIDFNGLNDIIPIIQNYKAVIAGSYVLQTICNENWANDIDIWCVNNGINIAEKLQNIGYRIYETVSYENLNELIARKKTIDLENMANENKVSKKASKAIKKSIQYWNNYNDNDNTEYRVSEYTRLLKYIKTIHFLKHETKPPIQIIEVYNIIDCITTFDLNICQVYYDGEHIYAKNAFKKAGFLACIKHRIAKITYEASKIQKPSEWIRTLNRALKYTNRGFFIDFNQAYPFLKKIAPLICREWNSVVCGSYYFQPILDNFVLVKTLKLPYFHSKIGGYLIFGYNVNPNNKMNSIVKNMMKYEIFRAPYPPHSNIRCLVKPRSNINEVKSLEKIVPEDVLDSIKSIYEPNYNPTLREWLNGLYKYYLNIIHFIMSGNDINIISEIEQYIDQEILQEPDQVKSLDIENPQKIFTDFRRYITDNGRAEKEVIVEYLQRLINIFTEINKKSKSNKFDVLIKLCNKLIKDKGYLKRRQVEYKYTNFIPLIEIIFRGTFRDYRFLDSIFNSILQQLCSNIPIEAENILYNDDFIERQFKEEKRKIKKVKAIVEDFCSTLSFDTNIKIALQNCIMFIVIENKNNTDLIHDIDFSINVVALWGDRKFSFVASDEQQRFLQPVDDMKEIEQIFYGEYNGYLYGITLEEFERHRTNSFYQTVKNVQEYLGKNDYVELLYAISHPLNNNISFDDFEKVYDYTTSQGKIINDRNIWLLENAYREMIFKRML